MVYNLKVRNLIEAMSHEDENINIKVAGSKTSSTFGICFVPVERHLLDGLTTYLRYIRTIYYGDFTRHPNGTDKSLFVTHSSKSIEMTQPSDGIEDLLKTACKEDNSAALKGKWKWSLTELRRCQATWLNEESLKTSKEFADMGSFFMHHSGM